MAPEFFDVKPIPRQLKDQVQIYFEEQLYTLALSLLTNVLGSGASSEQCQLVPRFIPPPQYLGLICNLIVHPRTTSRAGTLEARHAATMAQTYLENVLHMVGPVGGRLNEAFQFRSQNNRRRRANITYENASHASDPEEEDSIGGNMANLWNISPDFWSVVGWAFNCSVRYPVRWECWQPWLHLMIDILRRDWDYYCELSRDVEGEPQKEILHKSILLTYLSDKGGRNNNTFKWVKKALFADGMRGSISIFQEVFPNETKEVSSQRAKRKHSQTIDVEKNQFGDYESDDSCDASIKNGATSSFDTSVEDISSLQDPDLDEDEIGLYIESVPTRSKLISLLSDATFILKTEFISPQDFYEDIARDIRQQPFPIFQAFLNFTATCLLFPQYVYMTRELFSQLLPPSHTKPFKIDSQADGAGEITQQILEQCFLQHSAATVTYQDNAQLQLICEQTIIALNSERLIFRTESFVQIAEKGFQARMRKVKHPRTGRKGLGMSDKVAKDFLDQAPDRMKLILANISEVSH
ncbi:hypothetical protein HOO65_060413 [Ceratocystis lukuohia]|uniref:Uncharacterized protein n=1 Tax=Ceratocystis lukuohia TaxID=2019550 RepID=A0ABR4ME86_9PEZI